MAERRMFAKSIIDSDMFLEMPLSTQALYFHLAMRSDDDGFCNSPRKIQKMLGCTDMDVQILIDKKFILVFDSGVIVIKHWRIHNYIQKDRYKKSINVEEMSQLSLDDGVYKLSEECIQDVSSLDSQVSLGKDSLGYINNNGQISNICPVETKPKSKRIVFTPPSVEEVKAYISEKGYNIDAEYFVDYYESRGWCLKGNQKIKDWKACVRTWARNNFNSKGNNSFSNQQTAKSLDEQLKELYG